MCGSNKSMCDDRFESCIEKSCKELPVSMTWSEWTRRIFGIRQIVQDFAQQTTVRLRASNGYVMKFVNLYLCCLTVNLTEA
jgi:hypothetical protein